MFVFPRNEHLYRASVDFTFYREINEDFRTKDFGPADPLLLLLETFELLP